MTSQELSAFEKLGNGQGERGCPICREIHPKTRGLSFDGRGINSCGMYRSRLATFTKDAPEALGPLFAAAPALLAALDGLLAYPMDAEWDAQVEAARVAVSMARGGSHV